MRFVEEIVVEEFLPTVRSLLAADLRDRGLTQEEVADVLGVSQSAVSKYAHGEVRVNDRIAADTRVTDLIERVGSGLATGDVTPTQALIEIEVLVRELERGGDLLAELHEEAEPALATHDSGFRVHDPDSDVRSRERVLASLRRGLRSLENASGFAGLIPAVGSNLVACTADATTVDDVAGVPGRIVDVKGRATIPAPPEFGASEHVATVLLAARAAGASASAACNVRYGPAVIATLAEAGAVVTEFAAGDDVEDSVTAAVEATPETTVLYQTGAVGIEPITYVLGPDPVTVAERIRGLLETGR